MGTLEEHQVNQLNFGCLDFVVNFQFRKYQPNRDSRMSGKKFKKKINRSILNECESKQKKGIKQFNW